MVRSGRLFPIQVKEYGFDPFHIWVFMISLHKHILDLFLCAFAVLPMAKSDLSVFLTLKFLQF